jgi:hypothetical protein
MFPNRSCARAGLALLLALPLFAAACQARGGSDEEKQRDEQLKKLNAQSTFNASQKTRQPLLAVEVAVRADGVQAVGAKVIAAPAPKNSAEADLRVTARAGSRTLADYVIPDPRLAEVDTREGPGGQQVLPEGRTTVFAPLAEDITDIQIAPVAGREQRASKGGTLDVRALAVSACEGQTALEVCQKILRAKPGTTGSPSPTQSPSPAQSPTPATAPTRPPGTQD